MEIREIKKEEMKSAIDLVWKTFLKYEAPDYTEEGINEFEKSIRDEEWIQSREFIGAFENDEIVGVIATKDNNHIALFFVDGTHHKKGIGKALYNKIKRNNTTGYFTVNSSPYAHEVYQHLGFNDIDKEQLVNGLKFYPMKALLYEKVELKQYKLEKVKIEDKDILYRLLQYSLFEESLNDLNEMNDEAIFEYKWFDKYFIDNTREAYFVKEKSSNKLLGFAMVNEYMQKSENGHSIAEFMIIPKYRRLKIGKRVAIELFNMHKGNWEVKPSFGSKLAYEFWKNVINEYTENNNTYEDGIFIFKNI